MVHTLVEKFEVGKRMHKTGSRSLRSHAENTGAQPTTMLIFPYAVKANQGQKSLGEEFKRLGKRVAKGKAAQRIATKVD